VGACEPRQIREEAALSSYSQVCGVPGLFARFARFAFGSAFRSLLDDIRRCAAPARVGRGEGRKALRVICLNRPMAALYRKYRPQTFEEVVGQEAVVRTLTNAIATDAVRQAYLFAGPRGTGKTSMARILAKCLNCAQGPTTTPDGTCHACRAIAAGTSLDVIEMDAASQRGIDDIREIRDRVVLQPVEGRYKVYILDEAHQLTDAAWNALLKLIEEPPPHLVFVFCTTDLSKVLPTVRSRCQTFVFQRPRLQDLVRKLRLIADAEGIEVPDQALALVARGARGAYRDAESTLDQLASATGNQVTVPAVLELLGTVEEEALFRLCDLVIDRDTAGALTYLEELSERGHDLGRLVLDLIEHLRQLMLAQHLGDVPEAAASSEEARERMLSQANQLGEATVLRLIDLLAVAVDDMRQGADPRLPLELALVKVTRPASDLSRESIAFRLERLEQGEGHVPPPQPGSDPGPGPEETVAEAETPQEERVPVPVGAPALELEQLQEAWARTVLPAVEERGGIPTASLLREAHPAELSGDTLTLEFPPSARFHLDLVREPKNAALLADALYDVTGRRLELAFELGEARETPATNEEPAGEDKILELLKETFDAQERES